jgi:hypothetical protein
MTAAKRYPRRQRRPRLLAPPVELHSASERVALLRDLGAAECRACGDPVRECRLSPQGACPACEAEGVGLCEGCGEMFARRELHEGRCWGCPAGRSE